MLGLVDAPGGRKVHAHSVPRLGGVAVVLAAGLAIAVVPLFDPRSIEPLNWLARRPFVLAAGLIFAIGASLTAVLSLLALATADVHAS